MLKSEKPQENEEGSTAMTIKEIEEIKKKEKARQQRNVIIHSINKFHLSINSINQPIMAINRRHEKPKKAESAMQSFIINPPPFYQYNQSIK